MGFSLEVPPEGNKTIREDRCTLVYMDEAQDVTGGAKVVPSVCLMREVPPELLPQRAAVYPPDSAGDGGDDGSGSRPSSPSPTPSPPLLERLASHLTSVVAPLAPLGRPLGVLWSTFLSGCQPRAAALPLEWHPRQPWLAAADSCGRVQVVDLGPWSARAPHNGAGRPELLAAGPGSCRAVLAHERLQAQALSLAWCPTSPGLLAVGAPGAVALWAVAGEGRPPGTAAGRGSGPWVRALRTRVAGARVTSLSWSPDGRLLAAASPNQAGLQVWEVASGTPTCVAAGPVAFDTVRWSPCGNYVFAAGTGSRYFYIFETHRWRWARWQTDTSTAGAAASANANASASSSSSSSSTPGSPATALPAASVVAAAWAPPSASRPPVLLAALAGGAYPYLVAVHLVEQPPGLAAQLLPVGLPDLARGAAAAGAGGTTGASSSVSIADMAWDPAGERLAVLLAPAGKTSATQCVALYATTTEPLVSAALLGFARPPQRLARAAAAAAAGGGTAEEGRQDEASDGTADGQAAPGALLTAAPGALSIARLVPGSGARAAGGVASGAPTCIVSARVGTHGVYNLPCYF